MSKKLPLHDVHIRLGARMIEFGDYFMPLEYESIIKEHISVRNNVAIFDISHMGEFVVKGNSCIEFLQKVTTNNISSLSPGKAHYSCFTNENGGVIDDIIVYCLNKNEFLIIVNSINRQKDYEWLKNNIINNVDLYDYSDDYALFAIQGPESLKIVSKIFGHEISYKPFTFVLKNFENIDNILISATGYTGSLGYEILVKTKYSEKLWNIIFENGEEYNLIPAGLGARDTLRIEAGLCLYGNELTEEVTPLEAGLKWIVKFDEKDFIGKQNLIRQQKNGITKKLVGFELLEKNIARKNYKIYNDKEQLIGKVTSGTFSPYFKKSIGMGYVSKEHAEIGNEIYIDIRGKFIKAIIVKLPFYNAIRKFK